uniref:Uncharacterized protein n=1 Tax=Anguilla anguilla TaxID=7936 RepID=A0A0E9WKW7_ANGAN
MPHKHKVFSYPEPQNVFHHRQFQTALLATVTCFS